MKEKKYNFTNPQNSIWLTDNFFQTDNISNVGGALLFEEKVDFDLLEKAIFLFIEKMKKRFSIN